MQLISLFNTVAMNATLLGISISAKLDSWLRQNFSESENFLEEDLNQFLFFFQIGQIL